MDPKELEKLKANFNKLSVDEKIAAGVSFKLSHPHTSYGRSRIDTISPRDWAAYNRVENGAAIEPAAILIAAGAALVVGAFFWIKDSLSKK